MILRTETYRELEKDLAKIMGIEELVLYQRLSEVSRECLDGFNSDWDKYEEQNGRLRFFYKGKEITKEDILAKEHFRLFARRLGYLEEADFCVNGFSFWPNIEKHQMDIFMIYKEVLR